MASLLCIGSSSWKRQPSPQNTWAGTEARELPPGEPVQAWKQCSHPSRLLSVTSPMGRQHSASQMLLWHFQAWDYMPCRSLPSLASQPCRLPETSAGCSVAQSRWVLGVPSLVACSCWMGSYCVNPASTGITLCYLHKGNNQHSFKIKYRKWDFWIKTR